MDKHGDFSPLKPNWNTQAQLESKLLEFCSQTFDPRTRSDATQNPRQKVANGLASKEKLTVGN